MRTLLKRIRWPGFPASPVDLLRQVGYFALAYVAYRVVRGMVENDGTAAFQHAREVISLERSLHIFVEPAVQAWASGSYTLMAIAGWLYVNAQFTVTVAALLFLYFYRNPTFITVRNTLLIALGLALIGYYLYPTAPPRFLPEWGFVDSVSDVTGLKMSQSSALFSDFFNPYAAIPSMHIAFALIIGWPLARETKLLLVRALWVLYPLLIAFVIIATGNHFILDTILGVITAALARLLAGWAERAWQTLYKPLTPATSTTG